MMILEKVFFHQAARQENPLSYNLAGLVSLPVSVVCTLLMPRESWRLRGLSAWTPYVLRNSNVSYGDRSHFNLDLTIQKIDSHW